ncbi:glycoprotein-N-acetylgalactosamine 3-beta-galactosyltransferase 1-like [Penaeus japonicus]|uniref:glycoprotein-N-acetylgalactosamine 3-beta-galactosyltransferase 1-like n=1 Tax=Penaeus japonicus TaxID=27405 RepID=UPI001C717B11|nr:glycoprotein-N-acetylgalactosamine 3-beta-galactosyltransferase 1-like [Penaeus japonicus]
MGTRESKRWWILACLSVCSALVLLCGPSYTRISATPLLNMLPVRNIKVHENKDDAFELTDAQLKEAEAELSNSSDLKKAIELTKELQEARRLYKKVRVLCWVLMYPDGHDTKARPIKATWGKRCNKLIFMSTKDDPSVGAIDVGSLEGYTKLWNKTRSALQYIYKNHLEDFEWFLKADSDTYVLVDNLRYVLQDYDTNEPIYFGQHYKIYGGYNTGGAGHVMGREAIRRFVEQAIPNHKICKPERSKGEDVGMGEFLRPLHQGVAAGALVSYCKLSCCMDTIVYCIGGAVDV